MKIYISADMEGVAGVVDWDQCRAGAPGHEQGARLLLGEVNAAIEGAIAGGADEVTVNDSHGLMANLAPDLLAGRASYLSGRHKPDYMMQGLDASYDAVLFVGYHGSMPSRSVLSHTYNPRAVSDARIGGVRAAESGINALAAAGHGRAGGARHGRPVRRPRGAAVLPGHPGRRRQALSSPVRRPRACIPRWRASGCGKAPGRVWRNSPRAGR